MIKVLLFIFFGLYFNNFQQQEEPQYQDFIKENVKRDIPLITIDSLKTIDNIVFLDVREKEEFNVSHIRSAKNVGYIWFDMRSVYDIPKSAHIVVYCTIGNRSEKIGTKLIKAGYKNVYNLYGGLIQWTNDGQPLYRNDGAQTTEIHTYNKDWAQWVKKGAIVF